MAKHNLALRQLNLIHKTGHKTLSFFKKFISTDWINALKLVNIDRNTQSFKNDLKAGERFVWKKVLTIYCMFDILVSFLFSGYIYKFSIISYFQTEMRNAEDIWII